MKLRKSSCYILCVVDHRDWLGTAGGQFGSVVMNSRLGYTWLWYVYTWMLLTPQSENTGVYIWMPICVTIQWHKKMPDTKINQTLPKKIIGAGQATSQSPNHLLNGLLTYAWISPNFDRLTDRIKTVALINVLIRLETHGICRTNSYFSVAYTLET